MTLVSIPQIDHTGCSSVFKGGHCHVYSPTGVPIARVPRGQSLYLFRSPAYTNTTIPGPAQLVTLAASTIKMTATDLHHCLGHISISAVKRFVANGTIKGITLISDPNEHACEACTRGKIMRSSLPKTRTRARATRYGKLIQSDLWGPVQVHSLHGHLYAMSFIDD
ncbi:hypothetical protein DENSPDRAFT_784597, partial [Dentipellis sp. KUC8613]